MTVCSSIILRMRNVSNKGCRENQNTDFMFTKFFSENCAVEEIMLKTLMERQRLQTIWLMRVAYRIIKATRTHTHTQRNMSYLLLFHGNSGFINEPHCYILRTLPLLLNYCFKFRLKTKEPVL
jgi:hypothetical protein